MGILLFFSFLSGIITIAAPCIWPLLPIVLSASVVGKDHRRPLGITLGILVSFGLLTLTISYLVSIFRFDPTILRYVAVFILFFLGATMIAPPLTRIVESFVSRFAGRFSTGERKNGFVPGFITGLALGVVWTPCAGPILAAIATLAATRAVNFEIVLVTIAYLVGVGIPLFIFAYAGQRFINGSRALNKYTGTIQKVFGVVMIATALLIFSNYDKILQAKLLDLFPGYARFVVDLENNEAVREQLNAIGGKEDMVGKPFNPMGNDNGDLFNANYPAPELTGIVNWLNSEPLTLESLRGKVVLVDFWTYTCINCIRTLPHITSWYEKYKDDGFVVIGVHTPEFEFEKSTSNVQGALEQYKINYPVAQDNDYATWRAFNNHYWPAKYLIDKDGRIRYYHFGEGKYDETERAIQELLKETGSSVSEDLSNMPDETPRTRNSPETYLGSLRMEYYFPYGNIQKGDYEAIEISEGIPVNSFTLGGNWTVQDEYSESTGQSVLEYRFLANKVFLVMRSSDSTAKNVRVYLDGNLVDGSSAGVDVDEGVISVNEDNLYNLIDLKGKRGEHLLRLEFDTGVQVFAFTFG